MHLSNKTINSSIKGVFFLVHLVGPIKTIINSDVATVHNANVIETTKSKKVKFKRASVNLWLRHLIICTAHALSMGIL